MLQSSLFCVVNSRTRRSKLDATNATIQTKHEQHNQYATTVENQSVLMTLTDSKHHYSHKWQKVSEMNYVRLDKFRQISPLVFMARLKEEKRILFTELKYSDFAF